MKILSKKDLLYENFVIMLTVVQKILTIKDPILYIFFETSIYTTKHFEYHKNFFMKNEEIQSNCIKQFISENFEMLTHVSILDEHII